MTVGHPCDTTPAMHPEQRDHDLRTLAALLAEAGACEAAPCPNAATIRVRFTMPDTLAQIDLPMCPHHAHLHADKHAGMQTIDGRALVTLLDPAAR